MLRSLRWALEGSDCARQTGQFGKADHLTSKAQNTTPESQAKLKKLPDFSTLGYIYSDWAKDGFDGKQLTVTTYI